jgi:hypothetical protein
MVDQGHFATADSALERWRQTYPTIISRQSNAYRVAYNKGDYAVAKAHADTLGYGR